MDEATSTAATYSCSSGPVAQVLALVARDVQLECAVRDERPEGVPGVLAS